jgi:DNA-binding response OmpR family regulator
MIQVMNTETDKSMILIVDDEISERKLMSILATEYGYACDNAANSQEGEDLAA